MAGGFALLAAADFNAEEGVADGFNSSVMLWDAGGGGSSFPCMGLSVPFSSPAIHFARRSEQILDLICASAAVSYHV